MAIRKISRFFLVVLASAVAGCYSPGRLVTWNIAPYTTNFKNTPVGSKSCTIPCHSVKVPVGSFNLQAQWDTDHIRRAALAAGITNIYYIDVQTISFLADLYRRKRLIVYGD